MGAMTTTRLRNTIPREGSSAIGSTTPAASQAENQNRVVAHSLIQLARLLGRAAAHDVPLPTESLGVKP